VTGGAGFIASHLVDRLVLDDTQEIVIYDNLYRGRRENINHHRGNSRVVFMEADIRDYTRLMEAARGSDIIYHLAAQSNVMGAVNDPEYSFTTNVIGSYNVLKVASQTGVRKVIFSSSREVYGEPRSLPVDEEHPIGSKNPYGASKVAGEMYCRVFNNLFGVEVAILRLTNVYGPRDYDRIITIWLDCALKGKDLVVYGGKQVIDFVWIDQVVEAMLRATQIDLGDQVVNIGSGKGVHILDLANRILNLFQTKSKIDLQPARAPEVVKFIANVKLMQHVLGLEPPEDALFGLPRLLQNVNWGRSLCSNGY